MAAILIGILCLVAAAAIWHYGAGSPPVLLAAVALGLVGAILLVLGILAVADSEGIEGAAAVPGVLAKTLRQRRQASSKRAKRLQKEATGLANLRRRAVRGSSPTIY